MDERTNKRILEQKISFQVFKYILMKQVSFNYKIVCPDQTIHNVQSYLDITVWLLLCQTNFPHEAFELLQI